MFLPPMNGLKRSKESMHGVYKHFVPTARRTAQASFE